MAKHITWVGIDDDKMNLTVAVVRGQQREPEVQRIPMRTKRYGDGSVSSSGMRRVERSGFAMRRAPMASR